jgi:hypothetical protein
MRRAAYRRRSIEVTECTRPSAVFVASHFGLNLPADLARLIRQWAPERLASVV